MAAVRESLNALEARLLIADTGAVSASAIGSIGVGDYLVALGPGGPGDTVDVFVH